MVAACDRGGRRRAARSGRERGGAAGSGTCRMTTVSVVICAYSERRWNDLAAALDSVRSQTRRATEIVVVVDHNPRLLERLRETYSDLTLVENAGEPGLAA